MIILVVNVIAFLTQRAFETYSSVPIERYFALSFDGLRHGYVWQLLTYQLMHGGWLHVLLNCWGIYVFGRELESTFGAARFLTLYFGSGVAGGLLQMAAAGLFGGRFAGAVVGASAGLFGLIAAFATLYPERILTLLLFFIIPVSLRAKYLLLFSALIAGAGIAFPTDNIAHAAHLGGLLAGIGFVRYISKYPEGVSNVWARVAAMTRRRKRPTTSGRSSRRSMPAAEDLPADEFVIREVDPILDKISAHGIQSLTERERKILEAARSKMANR
jgi:membrane associated rhomboid family serine protease